MGKEAACSARIGGKRVRGKAHLESSSLRFSGDVRFNIDFAQMRDVVARNGVLHFRAAAGETTLELGDAAAAWANAILNPKSRLEKLGVKPAMRACVLGLTDDAFIKELDERLERSAARSARGTYDIIFRELASPRNLTDLARLGKRLEPNGALWLIYAKGRGAPLPEREVRNAFLETGLVDTKVVAFSQTHTAIKLVIPLGKRR